MRFVVREAQTQDFQEISKLMSETHHLQINNEPTIYRDKDNPILKKNQQQQLTINETKIFVVENTANNELLAYTNIKIITQNTVPQPSQDKSTYINDFCVKSTYKEIGIGKLLFRHIMDYAKACETNSLVLFEWVFNQDAVEFYHPKDYPRENNRMEIYL
ncbi:MAG: GNAT family N-acetyltransferase [Turicibacter sp.]